MGSDANETYVYADEESGYAFVARYKESYNPYAPENINLRCVIALGMATDDEIKAAKEKILEGEAAEFMGPYRVR